MNETSEIVQRICSQCNNAVDADARFCKYCGFDFANLTANVEANAVVESNPSTTEDKPRGNNTALYVLGGVAALVLVIIGFVVLKPTNHKSQESVIENSNANSASLLPNTLSAKAQEIEEKILRGEALNASDLEGLSTSELRILRNVHFARYGRKYQSPGLGDYFNTRSWYKPSDDFKDSLVNSTDKANINLILTLEKPNESIETTSANTQNTPTVVQATPTPSNGELTRDTVLSLMSGRRKDVALLFSRNQPDYQEAKYERLMSAKVISCKKFYPIQGYNIFKWNECVPGKSGNGLRVKSSVWLELELGHKAPSRVNGISKVDANTSYADVVFSFQQGEGYSLYSNYGNDFKSAWGSAPNTSDEVRRVILRMYDDGWRVERVD